MKVIVAGSRTVTDVVVVQRAIESCPWVRAMRELVSGGARGVDSLGERWARANGVNIKRFPADWNEHGKAAGPIRNNQMAEYADALVAVWDGKSRGTRHMIASATEHGLPTYIHPISE